MSDFLNSIKADLTSRSLRPVAALAAVALVAALAYAALAGGKPAQQASAPPQTGRYNVPAVLGPTVAEAPANPSSALAETTSGASVQHNGKVHNPFAPQPSGQGGEKEGSGSSGAVSAVTNSNATTETAIGPGGSVTGPLPGTGESSEGQSGASGEGSSGASEGAPAGAGGSTSPSGGHAPSGTGTSGSQGSAETVTIYRVSAKLQRLGASGKPLGKARKMQDIQPITPLPTRQNPLLTLLGATGPGKGAIFVLLRAPILHGPATCLKSPEDCVAISLPLHRSEELQYMGSEGNVVSYRLTVTAMKKVRIPKALAAAFEKKGVAIIKRRAKRLQHVVP